MRYLVQKTEGDMTAWLSIPDDADSSKAAFLNDRAKATEFRFEVTARAWAWDLDAEVIPIEEPKGES